jgi:flagellar motility protein MotE (MotC chaperone)
MIRIVRDLRLIPVALVASACLLALTTADLVFDGGRWLAGDSAPPPAAALIHAAPDAPPGDSLSWAQQMFNFPGGKGGAAVDIAPPLDAAAAARARAEAANPDITGSIVKNGHAGAGEAQPAQAGAPAAGAADKAKNNKAKNAGTETPIIGTIVPSNSVTLPSGAERAILLRLQQRREQLDTRARELDIRESLVKAAEKRIEARLTELKEVEVRIATETGQKNQAEAARFKALVTMYENMKPRDAAKIFDGLEMPVLLQVASKLNPRAMADIMAQMSAPTAERLTVEMASKAQAAGKNTTGELPKIEGAPTQP